MNDRQIQDRRYQALSTEIGGQKIYECAVTCAQDAGLRARELWIDSLGVPTVLRPPEEEEGNDDDRGCSRQRLLRRNARRLGAVRTDGVAVLNVADSEASEEFNRGKSTQVFQTVQPTPGRD